MKFNYNTTCPPTCNCSTALQKQIDVPSGGQWLDWLTEGLGVRETDSCWHATFALASLFTLYTWTLTRSNIKWLEGRSSHLRNCPGQRLFIFHEKRRLMWRSRGFFWSSLGFVEENSMLLCFWLFDLFIYYILASCWVSIQANQTPRWCTIGCWQLLWSLWSCDPRYYRF